MANPPRSTDEEDTLPGITLETIRRAAGLPPEAELVRRVVIDMRQAPEGVWELVLDDNKTVVLLSDTLVRAAVKNGGACELCGRE